MNCTTIPIEGDTLEDIAHTEYCLKKCAAYRQGMGIELSPLRPRDALLGNSAEVSEGAVHWAKGFDRTADLVGQRGRKPAVLQSLSVSHPDIEEFVTAKKILGNIENANISVQITNDFMEHLKENKP
jgi:ribonucleoside-diphosphate reductase alpha chain